MSMNADEVILKLRSHVALLTGTEADAVACDRPLHELGLDSMGFVDLLVFIEKQFNLSLMKSGLSQDDFASLSVLTRRIVGASQK
jgi:acyl carrier protein